MGIFEQWKLDKKSGVTIMHILDKCSELYVN